MVGLGTAAGGTVEFGVMMPPYGDAVAVEVTLLLGRG
jgi:hypothetical protein